MGFTLLKEKKNGFPWNCWQQVKGLNQNNPDQLEVQGF